MLAKRAIFLLPLATMLFVACSGGGRSIDQEKKALQLLGDAVGGKASYTCIDAGAMFRVDEDFNKLLAGKNIADNLHETARKLTKSIKDCEKVVFLFEVKQHPTIDQIRQILGKEDTDQSPATQSQLSSNPPMTMYQYGWISFGVKDDKVTVLTVGLQKEESHDKKNDGTPVLTKAIPPTNLVFTEISCPPHKNRQLIFDQLFMRLGVLPGVKHLGVTDKNPLEQNPKPSQLNVNGQSASVIYNGVTPEYFQTLNLSLLKGSYFSNSKENASSNAIILSQAVARNLFQNDDPIGKRISISGIGKDGLPLEIIGLVGDARHLGGGSSIGDVYIPFDQSSAPSVFVFIRLIPMIGDEELLNNWKNVIQSQTRTVYDALTVSDVKPVPSQVGVQ